MKLLQLFYMSVLHLACMLGKCDIVKYFISLNKFDIKQTNILKKLFFI